MSLNPLAILVIVVIGAAVFGGIVLLGLHSSTAPAAPPGTSNTISHIPDILNLPGFGTVRNQNPSSSAQPRQSSLAQSSGGTSGPDVIVEHNELPSPALSVPPAAGSFQQPRQSGALVPSSSARPQSASIPVPVPPSSSAQPRIFATSSQSFQPPSSLARPTQAQADAIASFSVFNASPQLRDLRTQMVKEGVIKQTEFAKVNTNGDMEQFLLKMVEWKAKKASSTPAQIKDAKDRITKAYDQIQAAGAGR